MGIALATTTTSRSEQQKRNQKGKRKKRKKKNVNMAARRTLTQIWLKDTATYPLFASIAAAIGLVAYCGTRTLVSHPDVYLSKSSRKTLIRDNHDEGAAFYNHGVRQSKNNRPQIPGLHNLNDKMGAKPPSILSSAGKNEIDAAFKAKLN